jgi:hypothetical protein
VLYSALATAPPSTSTLWDPSFGRDFSFLKSENDMSAVLLALGENTGLKNVTLTGFGLILGHESLCTAMQNGLGMNETLESLELKRIKVTDDNATFWCRAFSFLRTNKALKSLVVEVEADISSGASFVSTFCIDIVAMLQDNGSLESLSIQGYSNITLKADEYAALVTALQRNTTLKSLSMDHIGTLGLIDDQDKQMASLLKKDYALEHLPDIGRVGDTVAILRLNEARRRYLVEDGSSISSKRVDVNECDVHRFPSSVHFQRKQRVTYTSWI